MALMGRSFSPIGATPEDEEQLIRLAQALSATGAQKIQLPAPRITGSVLPPPTPLMAGPGAPIGGLGRAGLAGLASALLQSETGTVEVPRGAVGGALPTGISRGATTATPLPPAPLPPVLDSGTIGAAPVPPVSTPMATEAAISAAPPIAPPGESPRFPTPSIGFPYLPGALHDEANEAMMKSAGEAAKQAYAGKSPYEMIMSIGKTGAERQAFLKEGLLAGLEAQQAIAEAPQGADIPEGAREASQLFPQVLAKATGIGTPAMWGPLPPILPAGDYSYSPEPPPEYVLEALKNILDVTKYERLPR